MADKIDSNFLLTGNEWNNIEISNLSFSFADTLPSYYSPLFLPAHTLLFRPFTETEFSANPDPLYIDQQDIVRFLLLGNVSEFSGSNNINATLLQSSGYRVSFSDVINSNMFEVSSSGQISFLNQQRYSPSDPSITYDLNSLNKVSGLAGDVFINSLDPATANLIPSQEGFWVILHELGHSIAGLEDVHNTAHADGQLDSQKYTMMSYIPHGGVYATGLQLLDIAAIQDTYGQRNYSTRSGDTAYTLGQGLGFYGASPEDAFLYTIWDGSGLDVIDASAFNVGAVIDLRQGEFSSIGRNATGGPAVDNVAIAYYTVIENATGTSEADILIGNAWNNTLIGGGGNDRIFGDGASVADDSFVNSIKGADHGFRDVDPFRAYGTGNPAPATDGSGADILNGGIGNDFLYGGAGNDVLTGGEGNDHLFGGAGTADIADYTSDVTGAGISKNLPIPPGNGLKPAYEQ